MNYHKEFGISCGEMGWVPAPRYLLRRKRILDLLCEMPLGRVLEVGSGAGGLLHDLLLKGFICEALETSEAAREIAAFVNKGYELSIREKPAVDWNNKFNYILAFEVLEHIEDDIEALKQWANWLSVDGKLLISVPADPKKWNASDVWAGHVRRYLRKDLARVLEAADFRVEHLENYGFPLANFMEPIRSYCHNLQMKKSAAFSSMDEQRNAHNDRSGVDRKVESKFYPILSSWPGVQAMKIFYILQDLTSHREWGPGIIAMAEYQG